MMLNCRDASRLTSEDLDHPLSWSKRLALKLHLSMCRYCKRYARQLSFLHQIIDLGGEELEDVPFESEVHLCEDAKERIRQALH